MENIEKYFANVALKMAGGLEQGVFRVAVEAVGLIERSARKKMPGKTGDLGRSFKAEFVEKKGGKISAGAFSDLVYARIQEYGGTILPKRAKMLAVPITPKAKRIRPREWGSDALTLIRSKKNQLILATIQQNKNGKDTIKPQYVLKRSVKLQPQNYIADVEKEIGQTAEQILGKSVIATLGRGDVGNGNP